MLSESSIDDALEYEQLCVLVMGRCRWRIWVILWEVDMHVETALGRVAVILELETVWKRWIVRALRFIGMERRKLDSGSLEVNECL